MKLVDTHAHLDFPQFNNIREEVIARAIKEEVAVINSCLSPEGYGIVKKYDSLYLTVGCCLGSSKKN